MIAAQPPSQRMPSRLNKSFKIEKPFAKYRESLDTESILSNFSDRSHGSGFKNNYGISRVRSTISLASDVVVDESYRVSLKLSPSEIALLRYTWNKMLKDEQEQVEELMLPFPGSAWSFLKDKPLPRVSNSGNSALNALSTFCIHIYLNLLAMNPELEKLYPSLKHQAASMAGVLTLAINCLENLSSLDEYLLQLGKRHSRILGIEPAQFEMMGEAFIQAFYNRFGNAFTHESEVLWIKFYMYLANSLIQFGIDPVIRPGRTLEYLEDNSGTGLIYTSDFEVNSMLVSLGGRSDLTEATSIMSYTNTSPQSLLSKPSHKGMPAPVMTPVVPAPATKLNKSKRRTRLLGKKSDCTIV